MKMIRISLWLVLFLVAGAANRSFGQSASKAYSFSSLPVVKTTSFKKDSFLITRYGAAGDGIKLNSANINAAISACNAKGGGVVVVPAGVWLTGPVELKSNVNLHLEKGAILLFTTDFDQYPLVETNWEGNKAVRNQSPIWGKNLENVAVTGSGIIDGNGDAWRLVKKDKLTETQWKNLVASGGKVGEDKKTWYPSESAYRGSIAKSPGVIMPGRTLKDYADYKDFLRPNLIVLTGCRRVLLEGVTFQNSPAWCVHPLMCEDVTVRRISVKNPWYAQNGDGIDLESCKNVLIEDSVFDVGDDALCMKSGRDAQGRERNMPVENVIIRNCIVYKAHGGFVIGSEMSGGARNIFVSNCSFIGTDIGLRFKTTRGRGGLVEKIWIKDIFMTDIPGEAILFDMYYMAKDPILLAGEAAVVPKVELLPVTEETPRFRDFHISNVVCNGAATGVFIRGLPEMSIRDLSFENMTITAYRGIDAQEAENISFKNVKLYTKTGQPLAAISNSRNISFDKIGYTAGMPVLFELSGGKTTGITVTNTDMSGPTKKTAFKQGAPEASMSIK